MLTKLTYRLSDLDINTKPMLGMMGYTDDDIPPLFPETIEQELRLAQDKVSVLGAYVVLPAKMSSEDFTIVIGDQVFSPGKDIWQLYQGAEQVVVYACTIGDYIQERSAELMNQGQVLEGYVVDVMGSVIIERGMDRVHKHIKTNFNDKVTNRYSPGYWKWDVVEQQKLFSLLPQDCCGITLTDSALMHPVKSVSGLIGVGENVKFRKYNCTLCSQQDCIYKKNGKQKGCAYSNSI